MDQMQIGKFIAGTRKLNNFTQRQLVKALSISDRTISKWEAGVHLDEYPTPPPR
ncbi:MAG TPA: helix-turn-helix transcriptional regulator [Candidatus Scatavimonas merdigallinarum]|uniref:Helix-turn-helix transcriptional regulator n=1 Tax=Candidatus Scatavimonas merdigallinarum TaxID=2840914 RepID=A0A9D1CUL2_9FIRM|nr:helix-turn-helix transcriptional regulator [Candidatus Scatavimonas merdigallinarum]